MAFEPPNIASKDAWQSEVLGAAGGGVQGALDCALAFWGAATSGMH